jgi:hypothetical protein
MFTCCIGQERKGPTALIWEVRQISAVKLNQTREVEVTSFRRFVMGIAEAIQILSMIVCTVVGGVFGAVSGIFREFGFTGQLTVDRMSVVLSTSELLGFCIGALGGFVLSATLAGIVFTFVQIERNTRSLMDQETVRFIEPSKY